VNGTLQLLLGFHDGCFGLEHDLAESDRILKSIHKDFVSPLSLLKFRGQLLLHLNVVAHLSLQSAHLSILQLHFCVLQLVVLFEDLLFSALFPTDFLNICWLKCFLNI